MTAHSPRVMRCERCKAVISTAQATEMVRHGVPCGVCGGTLTLRTPQRRSLSGSDPGGDGVHRPSAECRLLGVLREAGGEPVGPRALAQAGIDDPASAIFELERAGYRIERAYTVESTGRRGFLGYRLWRGADRQANEALSSRSG
jgi:hypothetical protein